MRSECSMWNTLFFCFLCLNIFILCSAFFADMCYNKTIEEERKTSGKTAERKMKMDIEQRIKVLTYALDAVSFKIGDTKMLFANLDVPLNAGGAADAGLSACFEQYLNYQETATEIQRELSRIANCDGWQRIAINNAAVYICPVCDGKSPDDTRFCPQCGCFIGRGVRK